MHTIYREGVDEAAGFSALGRHGLMRRRGGPKAAVGECFRPTLPWEQEHLLTHQSIARRSRRGLRSRYRKPIQQDLALIHLGKSRQQHFTKVPLAEPVARRCRPVWPAGNGQLKFLNQILQRPP